MRQCALATTPSAVATTICLRAISSNTCATRRTIRARSVSAALPFCTAASRAPCGSTAFSSRATVSASGFLRRSWCGFVDSCGQQGTSYVQRGNVIRNNTFRHVRMRDEIHLGNPVISAVYLDDGMTGYRIEGNRFIDVMQGVMLNGGRDNLITDNYFQDVDRVTWLSDECKNPETYGELVNASQWPAWQKYKTQTPAMTVPADYSSFYNLSCVAGGNEYHDNVFCRADAVVTPAKSNARSASSFQNNTVHCQE